MNYGWKNLDIFPLDRLWPNRLCKNLNKPNVTSSTWTNRPVSAANPSTRLYCFVTKYYNFILCPNFSSILPNLAFQFIPPPAFLAFFRFADSIFATQRFRTCWFRIWHQFSNMRRTFTKMLPTFTKIFLVLFFCHFMIFIYYWWTVCI